jgi:DNA modification methylase
MSERDNATAPNPVFVDPVAQPTLFDLPAKTADLTLQDRFGVPPFSVLDGRGGQWLDRKRQWLSQGIRSELGRDDKLLDYVPLTTAHEKKVCGTCGGTGTTPGKVTKCRDCKGTGRRFASYAAIGSTSIFDPVLCELAYRWFCPPGGTVLDPFAGGSVRGLVAAILGRDYVGIDLRPEQIEENYAQAESVLEAHPEAGTPSWLEGDSRELPKLVTGTERVDFLFTCPPYYDLEKYSSDDRDLSNAGSYTKFLSGYRDIIGYGLRLLKPDRFAAIVVGEVRDAAGSYIGLVPDTIRAFEDHGARYYNEFILVTPLGTAPVRASSIFVSGRKTVKAHQNLLVFCKGDFKEAAAATPLPGANASRNTDAWVEAEHTEEVAE